MSVAEVKRHFSDVMAEVIHTKRRVVVERRGQTHGGYRSAGGEGS